VENAIQNGKLNVPDNPILPFIRGDGTGPDIWRRAWRVFDAAVQKAYGGKRKSPGLKCLPVKLPKTSFDNWLPDDTVAAFKDYLVGIKGPLTTPVGAASARSTSRCARCLDLYVCLRPVQWFTGVPLHL